MTVEEENIEQTTKTRRTKLIIIIGVVVLAVLVLVANVRRSHSTVRGIEVVLRLGDMPRLISDQDICDTIVAAMPGLLQSRVGQVNRHEVEQAAARVPYLTRISATTSTSGKVVVRATQRRPIMRLYYGHREYYLDNQQALFPSSTLGSVGVIVANGNFEGTPRADSLDAAVVSMWQVARFLDGSRRYDGLIDQLYCEQENNIIMVPKLGGHVVELGDATNLDRKFAALLAFYRKGMPRAGWDTYSRISLKYDGQVVCTKKQGQTSPKAAITP